MEVWGNLGLLETAGLGRLGALGMEMEGAGMEVIGASGVLGTLRGYWGH